MEDEVDTFKRLLDLYPTGILSVVSDTWDLWKVCTEYLPTLKEQILKRDGKLVIRPDSGDPVDILCGNPTRNPNQPEFKGVIELLWDTFGGTTIKGKDGKEYKQLDLHIGAIYGDSITLERAASICERLKAKGFASTNVVLGIGSYTYQYNTRDTFGFAVKATYGEISHQKMSGISVEPREIFKDPITDDGTKKSKKGLLAVYQRMDDLTIYCKDQCTPTEEQEGMLTTVFKDGKLVRKSTLEEIRNKLKV